MIDMEGTRTSWMVGKIIKQKWPLWETFLRVYRTGKWRFSIPAIPFLDIYQSKEDPKKGWYMDIYRLFLTEFILKCNIIRAYKKGNANTCYAMNKTRKYYTTWEKPDTQTSYCVIDSTDAKGKGIIWDQVGQPALQLFLWTVPWGDTTLPHGCKVS